MFHVERLFINAGLRFSVVSLFCFILLPKSGVGGRFRPSRAIGVTSFGGFDESNLYLNSETSETPDL